MIFKITNDVGVLTKKKKNKQLIKAIQKVNPRVIHIGVLYIFFNKLMLSNNNNHVELAI